MNKILFASFLILTAPSAIFATEKCQISEIKYELIFSRIQILPIKYLDNPIKIFMNKETLLEFSKINNLNIKEYNENKIYIAAIVNRNDNFTGFYKDETELHYYFDFGRTNRQIDCDVIPGKGYLWGRLFIITIEKTLDINLHLINLRKVVNETPEIIKTLSNKSL